MKREETAAIMQPTFLPWIGYFALMDMAEHFVFLDSVQFAKRSWQQRNRIKTANGPHWLTVPVFSKGAQEQLISEVKIDHSSRFVEKTVRTIEQAYAKAPFFKVYAPCFFDIFFKKHELLCDLNAELVRYCASVFGLHCKFHKSSDLGLRGVKADLLAGICEDLSMKTYLSAEGSREYIEQSAAFQRRGIGVVYNPYQPTEYLQLHGSFEPYLSVIDLLFNCGPESLRILREGLGKSVHH